MREDLLANRLEEFDSSTIRYAFELAEKIKNPIDLSIGFPEDNTPERIKEAAVKAIRLNKTRYTASNGTTQLREAIAHKLQKENNIYTSKDLIAVVPGLTNGILLIYLAILNPGDEIIIPDPFFPPYRDLARMVGAKPVLLDTFPDFQVTAERLAKLITNKTKAILINSPNNPSGAVYPEQELRRIDALAKKHNLIILSDEIYEHFSYDIPHFSVGSIYPNTITMNGFSKAYAMTGWRIGYLAGPPAIMSAIKELLQYTVFSTSSIAQEAALSALKYKASQITRKYNSKRNLVVRRLRKNFEVYGARGAFYAFVQLPNHTDDLVFTNMAAKKNLIILPGRAFSRRTNYIRIAYGAPAEEIKKGLDVIDELMRTKQLRKTPLKQRLKTL